MSQPEPARDHDRVCHPCEAICGQRQVREAGFMPVSVTDLPRTAAVVMTTPEPAGIAEP